VLGGSSGPKKKLRTLERYSEDKNEWEALNWRLHQGIDKPIVLPGESNELIFIGGNKKNGSTSDVFTLNLHKGTVCSKPSLKYPRAAHKGF